MDNQICGWNGSFETTAAASCLDIDSFFTGTPKSLVISSDAPAPQEVFVPQVKP